jgi:hypothetical protein
MTLAPNHQVFAVDRLLEQQKVSVAFSKITGACLYAWCVSRR